MSFKVNLSRNIIFTALANLSSAFLLVLLIYAGRALGVEDFGRFNFALALGTVFALAADFGLTEFTKRAVARDPGVAGQISGQCACVENAVICGRVYIDCGDGEFVT